MVSNNLIKYILLISSELLRMAASTTLPMQQKSIIQLTAIELSHSIQSRKVSCVEVMESYLVQIEKFNSQVNAIVSMQSKDGLLVAAACYDEMLDRGQWKGPLHGFPLAVKNLALTKGIISSFGSPILQNFVPNQDSIVVERMRAAGAIIIGKFYLILALFVAPHCNTPFIGKTNTPEFGLGSHTYNTIYGTTLNSYDQSKSAGGSSGGAAVCLALHMLPVADGSDFGE